MTDHSILSRIVDSHDRSVGGGSAAALAGSMGAGLAALVARLSEGGDYGTSPARCLEVADEADRLAAALERGAYADAEAYRGVVEAYRLPRGDADATQARQAAIQEALIAAATVPRDNARAARRVRDLCVGLKGRSNPNAVSDLAVGLMLAEAAVLGCVANIEINVPLIEDDEVSTGLLREAQHLKEF
jgi:formiminotetrahydrofolate cyclodeaminase